MQLPNWFRIAWWVLILGALTSFLTVRYPNLSQGQAGPLDTIVFLVWIALLLVPLFSEISIFGVVLKREVEALKADIEREISSIRTDIRNAVEIRTEVNPVFYIPQPPPDAQLPFIEDRIRTALREALRSQGIQPPPVQPQELHVPADTAMLFQARYNIEKEIRRLWREHMDDPVTARRLPITRMVQALAETGVIDSRIGSAVRDVYAVASLAVHGEAVSSAQIAFVRDVATELIAALRAIT